jgi:hypothetical protein
MKTSYIKALLICGFLPLIQACTENLQESPKTFISPENFFSNPASYESAVIGIYSNIGGYYSSNPMMMREMFSDINGAPSASFEQALPTYRNGHEPFFYNTRGEWSNSYSIIKNANFILSQLPGAPLDEATKNALTAEARFLRAYAYFQLVQFYGDIPLRTTPVENYSAVQAPKSSQEEVYNLIIEDLSYAESNLPENTAQQGRVYKAVATAMLAKVYLTTAGNPLKKTENYAKAKEKALSIINSGKFSLIEDYARVFHNSKYTSESIWEKLFVPGSGGNGLHGISSTALGYVTMLVPAPWFTASFPKGDQRRAWGIKDQYKGPAGTLLNPFFQKFVNNTYTETGVTPSGAGLLDYTIPIIRLAEIYLIAAEAENEVSGPANAYQYINVIRKRARVDKTDATHVPDLMGLSKDQLRSAILMERKWELHSEGSTWFDLKRTNTFSRIAETRGAELLNPIGNANQTWYIPDVEITNNNIPQNPSYQ